MSDGYNALMYAYQMTEIKTDKLYSMIPTLLSMAGRLDGKIVLDLECGTGWYARAFADAGAKRVIGYDASETHVHLAKATSGSEGVEFKVGNPFSARLPRVNIISAPFVLDTCRKARQMELLFGRCRKALLPNGRLLLIANAPNAHPPRAQSVRKIVEGPVLKDGVGLRVDYESHGGFIGSLHSHYFSEATIRQALKDAGFETIRKMTPIISAEGLRESGAGYWDRYKEDVELVYLVASV